MLYLYPYCIRDKLVIRGKQLFEEFDERRILKLLDTKTLRSGVVVLHFQNFKDK